MNKTFTHMTALLLALMSVSCGTVAVSGLANKVDCTGVAAKYAANIYPLFASLSCTSSGCHTGSSPAGSLNLNQTAAQTYDSLIAASGVLNTNDAASSKLLTMPVNSDGTHKAGGTIFSSLTDPNYIKIFCWIDAGGAQN